MYRSINIKKEFGEIFSRCLKATQDSCVKVFFRKFNTPPPSNADNFVLLSKFLILRDTVWTLQAVIKSLETLAEEGKVKEKAYGKQKVYVADQVCGACECFAICHYKIG